MQQGLSRYTVVAYLVYLRGAAKGDGNPEREKVSFYHTPVWTRDQLKVQKNKQKKKKITNLCRFDRREGIVVKKENLVEVEREHSGAAAEWSISTVCSLFHHLWRKSCVVNDLWFIKCSTWSGLKGKTYPCQSVEPRLWVRCQHVDSSCVEGSVLSDSFAKTKLIH